MADTIQVDCDGYKQPNGQSIKTSYVNISKRKRGLDLFIYMNLWRNMLVSA